MTTTNINIQVNTAQQARIQAHNMLNQQAVEMATHLLNGTTPVIPLKERVVNTIIATVSIGGAIGGIVYVGNWVNLVFVPSLTAVTS